jgi:HEAT repeat protein
MLMHGRRERKEAARRLLEGRDLDAVDRWAREERQAWSILQSLLFDADELVCWRAVEALGRVAAARAREDLEPVREMLRRTLWLMNDESGGLLWHGPQVLGAVLASVPALRGELLEVLASFLDEDPFRVGTRWALWRIATVQPEAVAVAAARLVPSLADPDAAVRGHAALALSAASGLAATAALAHDGAPLEVFDHRTRTLRSTTVREAASGLF